MLSFSPVPQEMVQTAGEDEQEAAAEAAETFLAEELPEATFGAAKAGSGMWASCLRVMHPTEVCGTWVTLDTHQLTSPVVSCRVALWTWCSLSKMKQPSGKALAYCMPARPAFEQRMQQLSVLRLDQQACCRTYQFIYSCLL